jgi:phosphoglycolate phosphatase
MSTFKAIVFDYDGTLFDTRPAIVYCIQRAFEQQCRPVPARELVLEAVKTGLTLQDTFLILDDELRTNRAALNEIVRTYRTLYLGEAAPLLKPFAGASEALQQLYFSGAKCLVVSNKGIAAIRRSLDDSGLSSFIDLIFGDEPGLPKKPDPAIVLDHILPRYADLQRTQILIVGDTEVDIRFAKGAGLASCWVSYGYGAAERCRALGPEHEIADISELPSLIHRH